MSNKYIWRPLPPWGESMTTLRPSGLKRGVVSQPNPGVVGRRHIAIGVRDPGVPGFRADVVETPAVALAMEGAGG